MAIKKAALAATCTRRGSSISAETVAYGMLVCPILSSNGTQKSPLVDWGNRMRNYERVFGLTVRAESTRRGA